MSAYVASDEHGDWYGDAGGVISDRFPTKEEAQAWVIERLNYVLSRPCLIYQDYRQAQKERREAIVETKKVQARLAEAEQRAAELRGRLIQEEEDTSAWANLYDEEAFAHQTTKDTLAAAEQRAAQAEQERDRLWVLAFWESSDWTNDTGQMWPLLQAMDRFLGTERLADRKALWASAIARGRALVEGQQ